jgi:AcrR family transcriptional regulator
MTSEATRPRDARATRDALLRAARARLAAHGYDDVSLRDIAADVGVNVALIHRYFGTKDDMFLDVLDTEKFLEGDPTTFGERLATAVVLDTVEVADLDNLMILVRSLGSERGRALAQGSRITRFQQPLIGWLGGEQAAERAFLIASLVIGAAITRDILANGSGLQADPLAIRDGLAERLQALVGPARD